MDRFSKQKRFNDISCFYLIYYLYHYIYIYYNTRFRKQKKYSFSFPFLICSVNTQCSFKSIDSKLEILDF